MQQIMNHYSYDSVQFNPEMQGWFDIGKSNTSDKHKQRQKSHDHQQMQKTDVGKIQHPCMIKTLKKIGIVRLNLTKATYDKPIANII